MTSWDNTSSIAHPCGCSFLLPSVDTLYHHLQFITEPSSVISIKISEAFCPTCSQLVYSLHFTNDKIMYLNSKLLELRANWSNSHKALTLKTPCKVYTKEHVLTKSSGHQGAARFDFFFLFSCRESRYTSLFSLAPDLTSSHGQTCSVLDWTSAKPACTHDDIDVFHTSAYVHTYEQIRKSAGVSANTHTLLILLFGTVS